MRSVFLPRKSLLRLTWRSAMYKNPAEQKRKVAEWYVRNKIAVAKKKHLSYQTRRASHLAWEARRRAKRKGYPYRLLPEDVARLQKIIDLGYCQITGSKFDLDTPRAWNSPSLDQIKPQVGYVRGNVRVVCRAMNFAMGEWGEDPVWEMFMNWSLRRKHSLKRISKQKA